MSERWSGPQSGNNFVPAKNVENTDEFGAMT